MSVPETISAIEEDYSREASRTITLAGLAEAWMRFADDIGAGYWGTIDDFTNDMFRRDMLELALSRVGPSDRQWLGGLIEAGDARYIEVTKEDPGWLARYFRHADYWWWYRAPRLLGHLEDHRR